MARKFAKRKFAKHGFLRGKSCTSQLLSVLQRISQNVDLGKQTDILYFDIAKAFDTVDHKLLLNKLSRFGITGNVLNWFKSYLSGRQQRVLLNGVISETLPVSSGVPQGSILGPLLFLIYVNDLPTSISSPSVDISMFADDTKCFSVVESPADACVLKTEASNVEKWALSWRLKFNPLKCKVLSVTRKHQPTVAEYTINGEILQHVSTQKDLGVTVSSDMKWNKHIYEQVTKANRMLGMLKRSTGKLKNVDTRRCLYLTLVRSHLAYASQVWSPQNTTMCMELERIQRRATKFILALPFKTDMSYKTRLVTLKLLPLCYWREFLDILFLFKCVHGLIESEHCAIKTVISYGYRECGTPSQMSCGDRTCQFIHSKDVFMSTITRQRKAYLTVMKYRHGNQYVLSATKQSSLQAQRNVAFKIVNCIIVCFM